MNIRNIILEIENNVTRLIDLPNLLQSSSKKDRRYAKFTLEKVFSEFYHLTDKYYSEDPHEFSNLVSNLSNFITEYHSQINKLNYKNASKEAISLMEKIIEEKQNGAYRFSE